jgi:hypothetical protein
MVRQTSRRSAISTEGAGPVSAASRIMPVLAVLSSPMEVFYYLSHHAPNEFRRFSGYFTCLSLRLVAAMDVKTYAPDRSAAVDAKELTPIAIA